MAAKKKPVEPASQSNLHISQLPFSEMLAHFATGGGELSSPTRMSADMQMSISGGPSKKNDPAPKRSGRVFLEDEDDDDGFEELMDDLSEPLTRESIRKEREARQAEEDAMDALMDDFDELIEGAFESDENIALRNSLVTMGRKYAIEGMQHGESSEVSRAFAKQEQMIYDLIEEEVKAGLEIQKDLDFLRTARTRSYKSIADLAAVRASLFGQRHSAIAELNKIAEKKFSITSKMKEGVDSGSEGAATRAVQQIFSMGRKALVMGDSPGDSGITEEEYQASLRGEEYEERLPGDAESVVQMTRPLPEATTDGDKFIQHEHENVEYVLDIGEDGDRKDIYAINGDGEIVPDYPLPSDPKSLNFMINDLTGTAVDQLQRTYRVRKNGVDLRGSDDDD